MSAADRPVAREQYVDRGAARLYVREIGDGAPIIVVHGGPDFDHEYLLPDMDRLADSFRLVYYDQRGRGRSFSGRPPDDVDLAGEIDDLDAVRQSFGFEAVAVLGHSWGALLAMEYAVRLPRRVSHLVLMNTAPASPAGALAFREELQRRRSRDQSERMSALRSAPGYQAGDVATDIECYRIHFASAFRRPDQLDRLLRGSDRRSPARASSPRGPSRIGSTHRRGSSGTTTCWLGSVGSASRPWSSTATTTSSRSRSLVRWPTRSRARASSCSPTAGTSPTSTSPTSRDGHRRAPAGGRLIRAFRSSRPSPADPSRHGRSSCGLDARFSGSS